MAKLPGISEYPEIILNIDKKSGDREIPYFLRVPFKSIAELKISVANRTMVNLGSGLVRHLFHYNGELVNPDGIRIVDRRVLIGGSESRVFHWDYGKHMQRLGITDDHGDVIAPAYVNGWRDLGQNPWHVLWESNPGLEEVITGDYTDPNSRILQRAQDRLVRLAEDERYGISRYRDLNTGRVYWCLVVPKEGKPHIRQLRFDKQQNAYDANMTVDLSKSILWAASGKPVLCNGEPLNIYDIVEQYYDVAHVFPVSKADPEIIGGRTDRPRKGSLVKMLYQGYPAQFKQNCTAALQQGLGTAEYYFDLVGVDEEALMILHTYGSLLEVAKKAKAKGMKDAILVDEGGSVAAWAWYHGDKGGFESCSSYLRPSAISVLAIKLNPQGDK